MRCSKGELFPWKGWFWRVEEVYVNSETQQVDSLTIRPLKLTSANQKIVDKLKEKEEKANERAERSKSHAMSHSGERGESGFSSKEAATLSRICSDSVRPEIRGNELQQQWEAEGHGEVVEGASGLSGTGENSGEKDTITLARNN